MPPLARLLTPLPFLLALTGLAPAETIVVWEETPTHRVKIKKVDGREVGRWSFPRKAAEKAAAPGVAASTSPPWSPHADLDEALAEARRRKVDLVAVGLFPDPASAQLAQLLAKPALRARAGDVVFHVLDLLGAVRGPRARVEAVMADLQRLGMHPTGHPVICWVSPEGIPYSCSTPTIDYFGKPTRLQEKEVASDLDAATLGRERQRMEQARAELRTLRDTGRFRELSKALGDVGRRALRHPELRAYAGPVIQHLGAPPSTPARSGSASAVQRDREDDASRWRSLGTAMQMDDLLFRVEAAFWSQDLETAAEYAAELAQVAGEAEFVYCEALTGHLFGVETRAGMLGKPVLEPIRRAALVLQARTHLVQGPRMDPGRAEALLRKALAAGKPDSLLGQEIQGLLARLPRARSRPGTR